MYHWMEKNDDFFCTFLGLHYLCPVLLILNKSLMVAGRVILDSCGIVAGYVE